jgi:hypothetical protein
VTAIVPVPASVERSIAMTARNFHRFASRPSFAALLAATLLPACGEPFDPPSLIERTRVLGATVQVTGDPTRATPRPGETATVSWIVTAPEALPALAWAFVLCRAGAASPAEACAPAPLALAQGTGVPVFVVTAPAAEVLGATPRLTLYGQICEGGAPVLDPQSNLPACPGAGTFATLDIFVERTDQANANPGLADRPLWLDDVALPADEHAPDCTTLPRVAAGSRGHVLRLRTLPEDRETFVSDPATAATAREALQISGFTTAGELGQSYAFVDAGDARAEADVEIGWDAPAEIPASGHVRFTFVARDLRGGVGVVTRTICIE